MYGTPRIFRPRGDTYFPGRCISRCRAATVPVRPLYPERPEPPKPLRVCRLPRVGIPRTGSRAQRLSLRQLARPVLVGVLRNVKAQAYTFRPRLAGALGALVLLGASFAQFSPVGAQSI